METELNRDNLRAFLVTLGSRMTAIVRDHEGEPAEFIPHGFACHLARYAESLPHVDEEILGLILETIRSFLELGDADVRDLLYASLFPWIEESVRLESAFLGAENDSVVEHYKKWLADD